MKMFGMCMNWKVVVGLGVVGLGVWAVAPSLIGAAAPLLLLAACPLSMIFMMRGMGSMDGGQSVAQPTQASGLSRIMGTREEQLVQLKARHEAIAREIAQLETACDQPCERDLASVATDGMSAN